MKRREFLAAAAALPLACQVKSSFHGQLVGASHQLGHKLGKTEMYQGRRQSVSVLILGGGMAALTAAWRLNAAGVDDFLILELEKQAGGNSRFAQYPASPAPWGAHYLPVPTQESRVVQRLLKEMGLILGFDAQGKARYDEGQLCHAAEERVYFQGRWEEGLFPRAAASPAEIAQMNAFEQHIQDWKTRRDSQGRKAFALPLAYSSPQWRELDRLSMADYLKRQGWDSPRLRWYVDYACRDDFGSSLEQTSAWAGLHYFAARDAEVGDIDFVWPEGNGRLVTYLSRSLGERLRCNQLVTSLRQEGKKWLVDVWSDGPAGYQAESVIWALPTFQRAYLLGEPARPDFVYSPWTVTNLVLRKLPDSAGQLAWDNVLYDSPGLGYVVANHQSSSTRLGPSVWTHYRPWAELDPKAARQQLLKTNWNQAVREVLEDLAQAHPDLPEVLERADVMHWGHAMISPRVGFLWGESRIQASQSRQGLHFAHSDLSGMSIFEEASFQGVRAAQEVLNARAKLREDFLLS
jgi:predicted NAD/FAD-dependent oxidoreductase